MPTIIEVNSPSKTNSPQMETPTPEPSATATIVQPTQTPTRRFEAFGERPLLHGINLGNALEAPAPGQWEVEIREEMFDAIAAAGFNAVRIPVRFSAHTGPRPMFTIDPDFLGVVDEAIRWGLERDLTVILDLHHFETLMADPGGEREKFLAIWEQLGYHYQDGPETLYFELLNEPMGNMTADLWNTLLKDGVAVIRKSNPTRKILVGSVDYSTIDALLSLSLPQDENLIATFHYYEPFAFTHQGAAWVPGSSAWTGTIWEGRESQKEEIQIALDNAVDWSNAQQVPLIMGEFGVIQTADQGSRVNWTKYVATAALDRGIGWLYWDFCAFFGIYSCEQNLWDPVMLDALQVQ